MGRRKAHPERLIYEDERIAARESDQYLVIEYKQPHRIYLPGSDHLWQDLEIVRLNRLKTLAGTKYLYQEAIGGCFGLSRQMVNRRVMAAKRKGVVGLLSGMYQRSKLTSEVLSRMAELFADNVFIGAERVAEILRTEKLVSSISSATVRHGLELMSAAKLIELLRQRACRDYAGILLGPDYLIERLFGVIEKLIEMIRRRRWGGLERLCHDTENLHQSFCRGGRRQDTYRPRKKLARDLRRRFNWLWSILRGKLSRKVRCPDCLESQVRFRFQRARYAWDSQGQRYQSFSQIYRCSNPLCQTKYFTLPPRELELYARYTTGAKRLTFKLLFHVRGSYRRVADFIGELGLAVHPTTIMRWVKKAGEEYTDMLRLQRRLGAETVIIDEKWVKVRDLWHFVFMATDAVADDLLHLELFKRNDQQAIKCFLLSLKALGIHPKVIVTDLLKAYAGVIAEVFPEAYHHECITHAKRAARTLVRQYFAGDEYQSIRKKLIKKLRRFFQSASVEELMRRFQEIQSLPRQYGEAVQPMIEMLAGYLPKFKTMLQRPDIPRTNNTVERVIKELDSKYQNTYGFSSFHVAAFTLKVFLVYYRYKKYASGRYRGQSPIQIKGLKLKTLSWTEYLFGHFSQLCQGQGA